MGNGGNGGKGSAASHDLKHVKAHKANVFRKRGIFEKIFLRRGDDVPLLFFGHRRSGATVGRGGDGKCPGLDLRKDKIFALCGDDVNLPVPPFKISPENCVALLGKIAAGNLLALGRRRARRRAGGTFFCVMDPERPPFLCSRFTLRENPARWVTGSKISKNFFGKFRRDRDGAPPPCVPLWDSPCDRQCRSRDKDGRALPFVCPLPPLREWTQRQ